SRHAGERGEKTPDEDTAGQQLLARHPVAETPQRHAGKRVEQREGCAERAERAVAQVPLLADRLSDGAADHAIEKIHRVDGEEDEERVLRAFHEERTVSESRPPPATPPPHPPARPEAAALAAEVLPLAAHGILQRRPLLVR